jgi:glucosamine kinase
MKPIILVGIDGGASKVKLKLTNLQNQTLAEANGGSCNIRLSTTTSWQSIEHAFKQALDTSQLDRKQYQFYAGLGVAGCEVLEAKTEFLKYPHPFQRIVVASDAYTACLGAHAGQDGIIVNIGTGIVAYQIYQQNNYKVGGFGFPHDDEGSGAWLGLQAVRHTVKTLDGRQTNTALSEQILKNFANNHTFTSWINQAHATEFASLAPIVITLAQQQETTALSLLKKVAQHASLLIQACDKHILQQKKLALCLMGSIAVHVQSLFDHTIIDRIQSAQYDACDGAIFMIKKTLKQND